MTHAGAALAAAFGSPGALPTDFEQATMKARRLSEVRDFIGSPEFVSWWESLVKVRAERDEARERHDELLSQAMLMDFRAELTQKHAIDTLYRAGDLEDEAAQMMVEAQQVENDSLRIVADFEEQRYRASESWFRSCALEKRLEELGDELAGAERRLAIAEGAIKREVELEVARLEAEKKRQEKLLGQVAQEKQREEQAKEKLWQEAERAWARSMELSLLIAEHKVRGRKVRAAAERLFRQAEERKQRAAKLRAEADAAAQEREAAEKKAAEVLARIRESDCALGEEHLYFRQKENPRRAWCVPLVEDAESYNIEIKPVTVYSIDHKRGVEFIEPAVEVAESEEESDRRFEEYFLKGRQGRVRADDERKSA